MAIAQITFRELIQDTQTYSSFEQGQSHLVSKIHFDLEIGAAKHPNMLVEVRQPYGTDYESEPLEVGPPLGTYDENWNHAQFSELCETYYRSLIGSKGTGIRIEGNASDIRMRDNRFVRSMSGSIEIPDEGSAAW